MTPTTRVPGLKIETILYRLTASVLANDVRDMCRYTAANDETGSFEAMFYVLPDQDLIAHIAAYSKPWTFTAYTTWT